jgi:hypothetical protein
MQYVNQKTGRKTHQLVGSGGGGGGGGYVLAPERQQQVTRAVAQTRATRRGL